MIIVNFALAVPPRTSAKLTGVPRSPPAGVTHGTPAAPDQHALTSAASHPAPHGWRSSWRGLSSAPFLARASQPTSRRRNPFPGLSPSPFLAPRSEERRGDGRLPSATIGPAIQALAPAQGHDHRVASGLTSRERRQQESRSPGLNVARSKPSPDQRRANTQQGQTQQDLHRGRGGVAGRPVLSRRPRRPSPR